ncbi:hypothetical protein PN36_35115 [Candidatus Thiomargarita nelsonii]|uniref:KfrA N-terminal DNA-binding domain-containing protein n=1 Tax=Candidatus Thiomargarita nelsonii TaxID=1003181 RepID=A0A4E0QLR3_9GAMM|nr:hypothetical protein PN36_35115 [Candidatus Thiomargarita nelsonii]
MLDTTPKLTIERVQETLKELKKEGIKPTNQLLIKRLGGSYGTLTRLKRAYPEVFSDFRKQNRVDLDGGFEASNTLEKENFDLKLENMALKFESERCKLKARIEVLERKLELEKLKGKISKEV